MNGQGIGRHSLGLANIVKGSEGVVLNHTACLMGQKLKNRRAQSEDQKSHSEDLIA